MQKNNSSILKSFVSYPDRGAGGNNLYRGNCSPLLIKDLLEYFKPCRVFDPMAGSMTTGDVCRGLGIDNICLDLNPALGGWDALADEVPMSSDFIIWHPPYHDIIQYSGNMWGQADSRDLSRCPSYEDFIGKINVIQEKLIYSLRRGGHIAILVGDIKKQGKLLSIQKDMTWYGQPLNVLIKAQNNCNSSRKNYTGRFIPITHEYLLIFKRDECYIIPTVSIVKSYHDIRDSQRSTWRDVVYSALTKLGGRAKLHEIYVEIEGHEKANNNQHWKEKIRQTLQLHPKDFTRIQEGVYQKVA